MEGCCTNYVGSTFSTEAYNGDWKYDGDYVGYPSYVNQLGTYYLWYESVSGYWAISNDKGDPQNQWVSSSDEQTTCPDGAYVSESGVMTCGEVSSSSSSISSSSSSQSD